MNFSELIEIAGARNLTESEAASAMTLMADGVPSPAEIRAFLSTPALSFESVDAATLTGLVRVVRARALALPGIRSRSIFDTCGTGGGISTFNISTAAALCAAAAGLTVAKHGNRAVASKSGSADVLEAMGIAIELEPGDAVASLNEGAFAFLFAQKYHRSFSFVQPVRRELAAEGRRTAFNLVGPLANPANPTHQVVGIFLGDKIGLLAEVLRRLGTEAALCVSGTTNSGAIVDEVSLAGETHAMLLRNGAITEVTLTPEDFGLARAPLESLAVGSANESAEMIRAVFDEREDDGAARNAVILNAAALFSLENGGDFRGGADRARATIRSGAAREFVAKLKHGT